MAIFCFLFRLYHYDDERLESVERALFEESNETLPELHARFYCRYEEGFCWAGKVVQPNAHMFFHLYESR